MLDKYRAWLESEMQTLGQAKRPMRTCWPNPKWPIAQSLDSILRGERDFR